MASSKTLAYSNNEVVPLAAKFGCIFEEVFRDVSEPTFTVRFWDESSWTKSPHDQSRFEFWLRNTDALDLLLKHPNDISFGEAFLRGDLYINGDYIRAIAAWPELKSRLRKRIAFDFAPLGEAWAELRRASFRFTESGIKHSKVRDKLASAATFDQPAEFFKLFLGSSMMYSSGCFSGETTDLAAAQGKRLLELSEKLALERNGRFLDVGCGWGSAALFAASKFEAHTRGITWSREQAHYGRDQASRSQMACLCRIDQRDYRDLEILHLPFDRAWSLGTVEHVGRRNISQYFANINDTLVPGGLFLIETCTRLNRVGAERDVFTNHFLFPDRELLTIEEIANAGKKGGFEVRDIEDIGSDYLRTLRCWLETLITNEEKAEHLVEKAVVRTWKLALASTAAAFEHGDVTAQQILLRKETNRRKTKSIDEEYWIVG